MRPKLLFLVTEDWYFWSHRLPVARAALQNGYEVVVATRVSTFGSLIQDEGFRLLPLQLSRESASPLKELRAIQQIREIYRTEQPDLVHHIALKPIVYGSIAALGQKNTKVINAWAGLGYLVASSSLRSRVLRFAIWNVFRFLMRSPNYYVLFQNYEDRDLLITKVKLPLEKTSIIKGAGVDLNDFQFSPEPIGILVVMLPSRMLWNKGVKEFVEAAKLLKGSGEIARFVLVGDSDIYSPSAIPRAQLLKWQASGAVEWWGHQSDMPSVLAQANLICLPSYREGIPKVLLEAAASGRAIVATDVPGCRDIVRDRINGLLVKPSDVVALSDAIRTLLRNASMRQQMAARGRQIVVKEFSQDIVVAQTLALYSDLMDLSEA